MAEMALYATRGKRRETGRMHRVVIYLRDDKDWTWVQRNRNGNGGLCLARCEMTPAAEEYCKERKRAASLQYTGKGTATLDGMADDLRTFELPEKTVQRFVAAALPEFAAEG